MFDWNRMNCTFECQTISIKVHWYYFKLWCGRVKNTGQKNNFGLMVARGEQSDFPWCKLFTAQYDCTKRLLKACNDCLIFLSAMCCHDFVVKHSECHSVLTACFGKMSSTRPSLLQPRQLANKSAKEPDRRPSIMNWSRQQEIHVVNGYIELVFVILKSHAVNLYVEHGCFEIALFRN